MKSENAFAVWITGLPASGKSTIVRSLTQMLEAQDVDAAVLESDVLRRILEDEPRYGEADRDIFYRSMVWIGKLLIDHGVSVVFDATANRRRYREQARKQIDRYMEVWVDTPLSICVGRDPKGIYRDGMADKSGNVPGLGAEYEPPLDAEVTVAGDRDRPEDAAARILKALLDKGYLLEVGR